MFPAGSDVVDVGIDHANISVAFLWIMCLTNSAFDDVSRGNLRDNIYKKGSSLVRNRHTTLGAIDPSWSYSFCVVLIQGDLGNALLARSDLDSVTIISLAASRSARSLLATASGRFTT